MPKHPYAPKSVEGIGAMLLAFVTNVNANPGARYQNQPVGKVSEPLNLTVRG